MVVLYSMKKIIYLADDEKSIRDVIQSFLESEGYSIRVFENGKQLLDVFQMDPCDLVILDVMMPVMDGYETCRNIRKISTIPIIMLSARDTEIDYATGINVGSDDYFTKPFSAISLTMRIKAIFRRIEMDTTAGFSKKEKLVFGNISLSENQKKVYIKDSLVDLTPNEFSLLQFMIENQTRAVSREELLQSIWGYNLEVETRVAE